MAVPDFKREHVETGRWMDLSLGLILSSEMLLAPGNHTLLCGEGAALIYGLLAVSSSNLITRKGRRVLVLKEGWWCGFGKTKRKCVCVCVWFGLTVSAGFDPVRILQPLHQHRFYSSSSSSSSSCILHIIFLH